MYEKLLFPSIIQTPDYTAPVFDWYTLSCHLPIGEYLCYLVADVLEDLLTVITKVATD